MKLLPFFAFYQAQACSDKFVNCASLAGSCNSSKYIRDTCQITCNSCDEKRQLSQYQMRQVEKPIRASKRKYARQLAKKYGINILGQDYCADIFSICPKYKYMCSFADSQYAQNCKKTCGLCNNKNKNSKPTQKPRTTPRKKKTQKPKTTKPRRTKKPKRTTTRKPKKTRAQKPETTTRAFSILWATAAPSPYTQQYQLPLAQYQHTPHYTQNAVPMYITPSYPYYVPQTAKAQPACDDKAQNCANTARYCHSAPGSALTEQIRKYCQKTCGMCSVPTMPPATITTRRTTPTPPPRQMTTTKIRQTAHSTPKKTRRTTTKPQRITPKPQMLPNPVPTVNITNLISRIPTIMTTTRKQETDTEMAIGEQTEKCEDKWSSCDLMYHRCNQSIIKSNCFKTCSSNCEAMLSSTVAPVTNMSAAAKTEAETTTEVLETTKTDAWTMTTASTTTIYAMSEINEDCEDILPTCASNRENCFHDGNELFLKVCRRTCGVCGVKDTFLIMAKQELSSMIVFKYQIGVGNFEHIDIVNEMSADLTGVCSVLWKDRPLFLGAGVNKDEVLSFGRDSCSFKEEKKLRHEFPNGICYSNNQEVFFCSPSSRGNLKSCWRFDDLNKIEDIPIHNHYHLRGSITEYENRLTLVAGNGEPKVEALEYPLWRELPSIPEDKVLYDLSTLVVDGRLLTFGGNRGEGSITNVWIFNGDMWFGGPRLKSARISPAVIKQGSKIIILGGCEEDSCQTETMEQKPGKMVFEKEELPRDLSGFGSFGSHVFLVDNRYCT